MYSIEYIAHGDISQADLYQVIDLKKSQWNYTVDDHFEWIEENIKNRDIHFFLILDGKKVAYLNLIEIDIYVNNEICRTWGLGNVCAIERGKGYGSKIMKEANQYIINSKKIGFLFCKDPLINFYKSLGWILLRKENFLDSSEQIKAMVFNLDYSPNICIKYNGKSF